MVEDIDLKNNKQIIVAFVRKMPVCLSLQSNVLSEIDWFNRMKTGVAQNS